MSQLITLHKAQGEGSRGGKVIGHTQSSAPIYEKHKAYAEVDKHGAPRSTGAQRAALGMQHFPSFTAQDHSDAADAHFDAKDKYAGGPKHEMHGKAFHLHFSAAKHLSKLGKSRARAPLGAAFSHARKEAAKTGGGRKKEREVANRYLKKKGHNSMGKAMPTANFGQYAQALVAQAQASQADQQYGWQRYMDLFALNHANTDRLRMEAQMRQLRAGQ